MRFTKSIATAVLVTLSFGILAGCFVESPYRYHRHHVIVVR